MPALPDPIVSSAPHRVPSRHGAPRLPGGAKLQHPTPNGDSPGRSQAYFDSNIHASAILWLAEPLTEVTDSMQADMNNFSHLDFDRMSGPFEQNTKVFFAPMHNDSEGLRSRLELLGICFCFLRMKFPSKSVPRTATLQLLTLYIRWLF